MATMLRFVAVAVFVYAISMDQYLCFLQVGGLSETMAVNSVVRNIFLETDLESVMVVPALMADAAGPAGDARLCPNGYASDFQKPRMPIVTISAVRQAMKDHDLLKDHANANLDPLTYRSQIVSGTNYFIKVHVKFHNVYFHVRIHKPGPWEENDNAQLIMMLSRTLCNGQPIKKHTPIVYF